MSTGYYYDEPPAPPAGKRQVGANGSYALAAGQTVSKVIVTIYKRVGNNLTYVAAVDDLAPANGSYKTSSVSLDIYEMKDGQQVRIQYTLIAKLYVTGSQQAAASGSETDIYLSEPPL